MFFLPNHNPPTVGMPVETLNTLIQLRDSSFGRPKPRHGLHLLYWFAKDFINFQMVPSENPANGCYGFHPFHNRIEDNDNSPLLPHQFLTYYEVGNLNMTKASQLPYYVRQQYTHRPDDSNTNRLIISVNSNGYIHRVYVTKHSDHTRFSSSGTYRISQGLISSIKGLRLDEFLDQMNYQNTYLQHSSFHRDEAHSQPTYRHTYTPSYTPDYSYARPVQNSEDNCAWICCVALIALVVVGGVVLLSVFGKRV